MELGLYYFSYWEADTTHRGRTRHFQVHGLKHQVGGVRELDDLSTHKTQLLVIVQHCVHVLNPNGVDWAVKDQPLPVWCLQYV